MKRSLILLFALFYLSCTVNSSFEIIDDYKLYRYEFDKWEFMCKLGCGEHPEIWNVMEVNWNEHTIIVKNKNEKELIEWHVFHSPTEKIKCCHGNTILGPLDSLTTVAFIIENKVNNLKTKIVAK